MYFMALSAMLLNYLIQYKLRNNYLTSPQLFLLSYRQTMSPVLRLL